MTSPEEPTRSELNKALDEACKRLGSPPSLLCPPEKRLCTKYHRDDSKCCPCWRQHLLEKVREDSPNSQS